MARYLYINPDPGTQSRATQLGCGWVAAPPPEFAAAVVGKTPCAVVSGAGLVSVIAEPTTPQAVAAAAQPIIDAEASAASAASALATNQATLQSRAQAALTANAAFQALASPTNGQTLAQVQLLTKECNGLIRLLLNQFDSTAGT